MHTVGGAKLVNLVSNFLFPPHSSGFQCGWCQYGVFSYVIHSSVGFFSTSSVFFGLTLHILTCFLGCDVASFGCRCYVQEVIIGKHE
jgi:hypothetical protein